MRCTKTVSTGSGCWAAAVLFAIHAAGAMAAEIEPYEARVVVARAQVRSGPGESFYPTDALVQGETVEVYRHEPGGWLAIRPPQGSFSWVFGRHLKLRAGGLAEVDKADAASRIGGQFGGSRNAVQVRLHQGEVVELLGEMTEDGETWYKIAPPAGEFRWIAAAQVKRIGALETAERDVMPIVVAASATQDEATADSKSAEPQPEAKAQADDSWRAAPSAASDLRGLMPPPLASSNDSPPVAAASSSAEPRNVSAPNPTAPVGGSSESFTRQLTELELRLSRMVAAPPDRWNTERLERDTEDLLAQVETADQRDALKAMLVKLDKFDSIARQHRGGVSDGSELAAVGQTDSDAGQLAQENGQYDAIGILRPVVSRRPGAPQFALVDERGQVISFVTPSPDVNLQPYLGHRIGITGTRGYIPEFQRAHVTAGRVAPLGERLVR